MAAASHGRSKSSVRRPAESRDSAEWPHGLLNRIVAIFIRDVQGHVAHRQPNSQNIPTKKPRKFIAFFFVSCEKGNGRWCALHSSTVNGGDSSICMFILRGAEQIRWPPKNRLLARCGPRPAAVWAPRETRSELARTEWQFMRPTPRNALC